MRRSRSAPTPSPLKGFVERPATAVAKNKFMKNVFNNGERAVMAFRAARFETYSQWYKDRIAWEIRN